MGSLLLAGAAISLTASGCGVVRRIIPVDTRVDVVPFLVPHHTASLDDLVAHINDWAAIESLVLRVDLQFETVEKAEAGEGRKYRTAQGRLLLARPKRIRLNIEAPVLSASIAEMASNGERFQLLIHPVEHRSLIQGTNETSYGDEVENLSEDPELEQAGPLANIRPQHFTDAFLLTPIPSDEREIATFLEEERLEEPDTRPGAKDDARVRKSYYVVTVVRLGDVSPRSRYWFDRTNELELRRQQVYDPAGRLIADIRYASYLPAQGGTTVRVASEVLIDRPYENYSLKLTVKPDGVMVNRELPDTAFVVDAPEEWGDTVRRIDLDNRDSTP